MRTVRMLKRMDAILGRAALALLPSARTGAFPPEIRRILFIRPGGIGDAVLLIPAIEAVKHAFPDSSIDVLAEKRNAEVFLLCQEVERVLHYDKFAELLFAIGRRYDVVIDTEQWHRLSAVVARVLRAKMSMGFSTNERSRMFSHAVSYSQDDYEAKSFLCLIRPLAGETVFDPSHPFLSVTEQYRAEIERHLKHISNDGIIALFPGSSVAERQWGRDRFHEVAKGLNARGHSIVVIGGKGDASDGIEIIRGLSNALNLAGKLSLPETAAVLTRSKLLITGDSGIMHLAHAVGTPIVALFGPGIEKKWAPRSSRVIVINKGLPCSPCTKFGYTSTCPIDAECMKRIAVEEVMEKAMILLEQV